ncbi:MAG: hypothetical protein PVS3B3_25000 [Ktedonobacteraceae bacterium]
MGRFTNSVLLGIGISFLFAPTSGQQTRRFLIQRFSYIRGIPPENEGLKQQVQQMAERVKDVQQKANQVAEMGSTVQNYAQETARSVNSVQSDLGAMTQQTDSDVTAARPPVSRRQKQPERQGE